jgi:hypothetical protein
MRSIGAFIGRPRAPAVTALWLPESVPLVRRASSWQNHNLFFEDSGSDDRKE